MRVGNWRAPGAEWRSPRWLTWRVSPRQFRLIAAAAVWALVLTIVSGAAVRLTGSGLGCPDWPNCTASGVVAPLQLHAWVEFGNRLVNALVTFAAVGTLMASMRRVPRRRDLTLLSAGLLVGLVAEVALGALVVEYKLAPGLVMAHFLLGMAFLADAVLLHHRAGLPDAAIDPAATATAATATTATDPAPPHPPPTTPPPPAATTTAAAAAAATTVRLVGRVPLTLARLQLAATAAAITLGTVVTSTGPHGGDPSARRFGFSLHSVAQLHGTFVEGLLAITLLTIWSLARDQAPPAVLRRAEVMLAAMAAQAAVGYAQYLNGDPVALVAIHVAGASLLVVAVLRFYLGLAAYLPATAPRAAAPAPTLSRTV
jgi:cytochrome c oxidase assembly protein subunit 15